MVGILMTDEGPVVIPPITPEALERLVAEARKHDAPHRALVGARIAARSGAPPQVEIARLLDVAQTAIIRARAIITGGTPELQDAVARGQVAIGLACRLATLPAEEQTRFLATVRGGVHPKTAGRMFKLPERYPSQRRPREAPSNEPPRQGPQRHQYLTGAALRAVVDSLGALDLVLRTTGGLDPSITPEQARRWLAELTRTRGSVARVSKILQERRDDQS